MKHIRTALLYLLSLLALMACGIIVMKLLNAAFTLDLDGRAGSLGARCGLVAWLLMTVISIRRRHRK